MKETTTKPICFYCIHEVQCEGKPYCQMKSYEPTAEVLPNFPRGSSAGWKHSWSFTRQLVYVRDKRKCYFCKKIVLAGNEVHHLKRRENKGSNHPRNLVNVCKRCHKITLASHTERNLISQKLKQTYSAYWKSHGIVKHTEKGKL